MRRSKPKSRWREFLRQLFCRHDWQASKFQSLAGGFSYRCTKCGKYRHVD